LSCFDKQKRNRILNKTAACGLRPRCMDTRKLVSSRNTQVVVGSVGPLFLNHHPRPREEAAAGRGSNFFEQRRCRAVWPPRGCHLHHHHRSSPCLPGHTARQLPRTCAHHRRHQHCGASRSHRTARCGPMTPSCSSQPPKSEDDNNSSGARKRTKAKETKTKTKPRRRRDCRTSSGASSPYLYL
jgi:hypothetical protein